MVSLGDALLVLGLQKLMLRSRVTSSRASMNSTLPRRSGGLLVRQITMQASIGEL